MSSVESPPPKTAMAPIVLQSRRVDLGHARREPVVHPVVLLAYFVTKVLVARATVERYHMKVAMVLVLGLVAAGIAVIQAVQGYESSIAALVGFAFAMFALLSCGMTIAFRVMLPRVGVVLPRILLDLLTFLGVLFVLIVVGQRAGFSIAGQGHRDRRSATSGKRCSAPVRRLRSRTCSAGSAASSGCRCHEHGGSLAERSDRAA